MDTKGGGQIGGGGAIETLTTEDVDFTLNALRNPEPVGCSKERSHVITFMLSENETGGVVLNKLENMDGRAQNVTKKRVYRSGCEKGQGRNTSSLVTVGWKMF